MQRKSSSRLMIRPARREWSHPAAFMFWHVPNWSISNTCVATAACSSTSGFTTTPPSSRGVLNLRLLIVREFFEYLTNFWHLMGVTLIPPGHVDVSAHSGERHSNTTVPMVLRTNISPPSELSVCGEQGFAQ